MEETLGNREGRGDRQGKGREKGGDGGTGHRVDRREGRPRETEKRRPNLREKPEEVAVLPPPFLGRGSGIPGGNSFSRSLSPHGPVTGMGDEGLAAACGSLRTVWTGAGPMGFGIPCLCRSDESLLSPSPSLSRGKVVPTGQDPMGKALPPLPRALRIAESNKEEAGRPRGLRQQLGALEAGQAPPPSPALTAAAPPPPWSACISHRADVASSTCQG